MANNKDWVPAREQDLIDLLVHWEAILGSSAKRTEYTWDAPECAAVLLRLADFLNARTEYHNDKTPGNRLAKDAEKAKIVAAMRDFANTSIRWNKKIPIQDRLNLGVGLKDETDTPQGEVRDTVEMTVTNDPVANSHTHIIPYKKQGAENRAKAPWHLAVFQTYVQGPGAPDPDIHNDAMWSKDIINMTSPLRHQHDTADAGKMAWYRAHWEAEGGKKSEWTMACATIP